MVMMVFAADVIEVFQKYLWSPALVLCVLGMMEVSKRIHCGKLFALMVGWVCLLLWVMSLVDFESRVGLWLVV